MSSPEEAKPSARVLVVEDEPDIAALIAYQLTREGLRVETAATGPEGLSAVGREPPDLIVLDRMLPGLSGDQVLRELKAEPATARIPVLVLTAKREQEERIEGFELGADDYLTKPFSPKELALRVRAILRRSGAVTSAEAGRVLRAGPIRLDTGALRATLAGRELDLTPTELRLLQVLLERRGRTQSRRQLLEGAWDVGAAVSERLHTRTVDMHVRRLRAKLGAVGESIRTVRGFGYRLDLPGESTPGAATPVGSAPTASTPGGSSPDTSSPGGSAESSPAASSTGEDPSEGSGAGSPG